MCQSNEQSFNWLISSDLDTPTAHVLPFNDLKIHRESVDCWCHPDIEIVDEYGSTVIIHHSMDGREEYEQGARGLN